MHLVHTTNRSIAGLRMQKTMCMRLLLSTASCRACCYEYGLVNLAHAAKHKRRNQLELAHCGKCQRMSDQFGASHKITWGNISMQCQQLWVKMRCKTSPNSGLAQPAAISLYST